MKDRGFFIGWVCIFSLLAVTVAVSSAADNCTSFNSEGRKVEVLLSMDEFPLEERVYDELVRTLAKNREIDFSGFSKDVVSEAFSKTFDGKELCPQFIEEINERVEVVSQGRLHVEKGEKGFQLIPGNHGVLKVTNSENGQFREYIIAPDAKMAVMSLD